ncbi:hypothetical protein [Flavobacterium sp. K5-23]|uniref:hypothetical protein n=1 Tax=Flavobacterium sp. K5-23 TaxID=2746225 RepID=UPI00200C5D65|nr:hypothetical protein [Flavobacterium sp. K5-23]UQD55352.1 hypothetical protein FLAK523_02655 [Flavobacterium sp. K5-23]
MKNLALIFIFLCYCPTYGQDIEYIKKLDTVYVKFKKSTNQTKEVVADYRFYTIRLGEVSERTSLYFIKPSFDEKATDQIKKYLPRTENKSFLKKHKNDIVGIDFFKKYGIIKSTYGAFSVNCVIYLIDCDEQKKGEITLYRVSMSSSYSMGE